jgi:flagellar hook-basal body complex protein FliE
MVMSDPLGLIGQAGANQSKAIGPGMGVGGAGKAQGGPSFRDVLMENIDKANELQNGARTAMEDLAAGRRGDIEGVMLATEKAETAFKMLQAVRNKVVQAYEEIQQIRV